MIKALFWDFDGTLIHQNESFVCAFSNALNNCGYSIRLDLIRKLMHSACNMIRHNDVFIYNTF